MSPLQPQAQQIAYPVSRFTLRDGWWSSWKTHRPFAHSPFPRRSTPSEAKNSRGVGRRSRQKWPFLDKGDMAYIAGAVRERLMSQASSSSERNAVTRAPRRMGRISKVPLAIQAYRVALEIPKRLAVSCGRSKFIISFTFQTVVQWP